MDYLNKGIYTYSDVSRIVGLSRARIKGFVDVRKTSKRRQPLLEVKKFIFGNREYFTFLDLIELKFIQHFMKQGMKRNDIIRAYHKIKDEFEKEHPFATTCISDSQRIFLDNSQVLLNPNDRQLWLREISRPELLEGIDFKGDLAVKWTPYKDIPEVVLDPFYRYGKPIIKGKNIKTETLYNAYISESEDENKVAEWYGINPELVRKAVDFEKRLGV